ncbi:hypothetical protein DPMN_007883 [Dreissena polymorpha]|uniref:Uncharacterized protein n=1 Tax=Dreissena polymorpha TaxID=45954 RepID=A0A9D4MY63_DREPO|nr:hypothetical protein DPMN_007883 [Dreissena polymorpha]
MSSMVRKASNALTGRSWKLATEKVPLLGIVAVIKRAADGAVLHGEDIVNAVSMYDTLTKKGIAPHLFLITDDQF